MVKRRALLQACLLLPVVKKETVMKKRKEIINNIICNKKILLGFDYSPFHLPPLSPARPRPEVSTRAPPRRHPFSLATATRTPHTPSTSPPRPPSPFLVFSRGGRTFDFRLSIISV